MKNKIVVFILFGLVGCINPPKKVLQLAPETIEYITAFEQASIKYNRTTVVDNLIVTMNEDSSFTGNTLALCRLYDDNPTPHVFIKKSTWDRMNTWDKRELIFHELGHCILRRPHTSEFITIYINGIANNLPASLMYPTHLGSNIYNSKTVDQYDAELFR